MKNCMSRIKSFLYRAKKTPFIIKRRLFYYLLLDLANSPNGLLYKPFVKPKSPSISIARDYVNRFVSSCLKDIKGDVLEVGRSTYNAELVDHATSYTCLDIGTFPDVDIVANIQNMPQVPSNSYDSILCTQVLEHTKNPFRAVSELHRILRPGGKLFLTVPFLNKIHMEPHDYWRFTEFSVAHLLSSFQRVDISKYGNTVNCVFYTLNIKTVDLSEEILQQETCEDRFYIILGAVAKKGDQ
ncbi:methyltransferase domain-containing protein [Thermodesulfobacteriota bacterium]